MSEQELYNQLKPLEKSMNQYLQNKLGGLSANETDIIRKTFQTVKTMVKTPMPVQFQTSCSACVKQVFVSYIDLYFKLKDKFESKPEIKSGGNRKK